LKINPYFHFKESMSSRIKVLPEDLANKISAGEVIERPASVIKELVENSIDAGANNIFIDIRGSGKQLIRVEDDGEGMEQDDAIMAFERHATSKIRSIEDLYAINSLGFRGEALPSIASVSRIKLRTCANNEGAGVFVELEGGKLLKVEEIGFPQGTTVEVRNLFFNTPARLKFLKSNTTELSHICQIITQQALARPPISFKLYHNQRPLIQLPQAKDHFSRLVSLFGLDFSQRLLPLEISDRLMQASGFISSPSFQHSSRKYHYIFLNGRCIKNKLLQQAITHAYHTHLPKEKYPAIFLFIQIDPTQVDCNVHPAKIEVRLKREADIYNLLLEAIKKTLWDQHKKGIGLPQIDFPIKQSGISRPPMPIPPEADETRGEISIGKGKSSIPSRQNNGRKVIPQSFPEQLLPSSSFSWQDPWIPIGQIQNSFILIESREAVLVIDQHGAHERIIFEELRQNLEKHSRGQQLLISETIQLTKAESLLLEDYIRDFAQLGFLLEPFGENTFVIRSIPTLLVGKDYKQVILDMLDTLAGLGKLGSLSDALEEMMMVMACHAAIKSHEHLQPKEIEALIHQLRDLGPSQTCPHGRPIIQSLPIEDIKKKFMRH
jgi:DNA mismatch repair protein MutL